MLAPVGKYRAGRRCRRQALAPFTSPSLTLASALLGKLRVRTWDCTDC